MNIATPQEQFESRKRLKALFYTPREEPRSVPKFRVLRKRFVHDPYAPRCQWPRERREWMHEDRGPVRPTVRQIISAASIYFDVPEIDVISKRRTAQVIRPRHVAMYLARKMTFCSLPEIARRFSGRDHTTVISAVRKIERNLLCDESLRRDVANVQSKVESWL